MLDRIINFNKIVYHGTTKSYHEQQLQKFKRYQHDKSKLYLSNTSSIPISFALLRARQYSDEPVLLVINTSKINSNLIWEQLAEFPECDFLERDWYGILNIESKDGTISSKDIQKLELLENIVLQKYAKNKKLNKFINTLLF